MLKHESQKSISVRFNLSRDDERRIYDEVMSHNRNVSEDPYGSSGAYIKAALKNYMEGRSVDESYDHTYEELIEFINEIEGRFMDELSRIRACVREDIRSEMGKLQVPQRLQVEEESVIADLDKEDAGDVPDEALDFLDSFLS